MQKIIHSAKTVKFAALGLLLLILALFVVYHRPNTSEAPAHQLSRLHTTTVNLTGQILAGHSYSKSTEYGEDRCINEGEDSWSLRGGDTIHCFYGTEVHTDIKGSELRSRIEQAGGWRGLYNDGSGSDYTLTYKDAHCSISDGKIYHNKQDAENNFMDGYLSINCQNFTDQKQSPLPAPKYPTD